MGLLVGQLFTKRMSKDRHAWEENWSAPLEGTTTTLNKNLNGRGTGSWNARALINGISDPPYAPMSKLISLGRRLVLFSEHSNFEFGVRGSSMWNSSFFPGGLTALLCAVASHGPVLLL